MVNQVQGLVPVGSSLSKTHPVLVGGRDSSNNAKAFLLDSNGNISAVLAAGTALLGKVGIDQTTDGTTNKVQARNATADNFLVNANIQVGDADVSTTNPVPVRPDFKQQSYIIPLFQVGGAALANMPTDDGVEIISNSASDVNKITIFGTDHATGALVLETVTMTGVTFVPTTKVNWGSVYGVFLGDTEGKNSTVAVGTITIRKATGDATICQISAGARSTGTLAFDLTGKNITAHNISGNTWKNAGTYPTTNNALKLTAGLAVDENIVTYLYLLGDVTGSTMQIEVLAN